MDANDAVRFQAERTVVIETQATPTPEAGEVLIETERSLVSTGTELAMLRGDHQRLGLPRTPGYCNVGRIVDVGTDVSADRIGDRVASEASHRRYNAIEASACRPVPESITPEEAAFFFLAETAMNGLRRGAVDWGEAVGVYGLGLVGQLTVRCCHVAGARPVVGLDVADSRVASLPDSTGIVGANPSNAEWRDRVREATRGRPFDVVVEATGNADAIPGAFELLDERGRLVLLSSPRSETTFDFYRHCHLPSTTIVGAHAESAPETATPQTPWTKHRHSQLFFDYLDEGAIELASLISHRPSVEEAPEVYASLLEDRTDALGIVFEW